MFLNTCKLILAGTVNHLISLSKKCLIYISYHSSQIAFRWSGEVWHPNYKVRPANVIKDLNIQYSNMNEFFFSSLSHFSTYLHYKLPNRYFLALYQKTATSQHVSHLCFTEQILNKLEANTFRSDLSETII